MLPAHHKSATLNVELTDLLVQCDGNRITPLFKEKIEKEVDLKKTTFQGFCGYRCVVVPNNSHKFNEM